ncbi:hypothetical protein L3V79_09085 [Thiotrichales bacterium 19S9-12]|nr:hypothetical protein [Thiotrichales bacterium 19S9-11]MCF6812511.1 hypothetical protein [Thiotrichales bacterium 19S9-12]
MRSLIQTSKQIFTIFQTHPTSDFLDIIKPYKLHVNVNEKDLEKATEIVQDMLKRDDCPIIAMKIINPGVRDNAVMNTQQKLSKALSDHDDFEIEYLEKVIRSKLRYKGKCQFTFYIFDNEEKKYIMFFKELEKMFKETNIQLGDKMSFPDRMLSIYVSGRWDRDSDGDYISETSMDLLCDEEKEYIKQNTEKCSLFNLIEKEFCNDQKNEEQKSTKPTDAPTISYSYDQGKLTGCKPVEYYPPL